MEDIQSPEFNIIYKFEDKVPFMQGLLVAVQHFLAIFIPIVTPAVIICNTLSLGVKTSSYIVSMTLIFSGIGTFLQIRKFGSIGSGLLSIQGTSSNFILPLIILGKAGGLPLIFGICLLGALFQVFTGFILPYLKRLFPPLVTGIVVIIIGISLIKISIINCAGGIVAQKNGTYGSLSNLGLSGVVIAVIIFFSISKNKKFQLGAILFGILAGYVLAIFMGKLPIAVILMNLKAAPLLNIPRPFRFGMHFDIKYLAPLILIYLVTVIESVGDLTATSAVSQEPIIGQTYFKRMSGGILSEGINSVLNAIFGGIPLTTFAQNNGVIQMTGVASRYIGYFIAAILIIFGIFPFFGVILIFMPNPVLGGVTLIMFGMIAAYGVKIVLMDKLDRRAITIMAISFGFGFSVIFEPQVLQHFPDTIQNIFSSSITTGGLVAIALNLCLPKNM